MKEQDLIMALANHGDHLRRYELMMPNVFIQHDSEADLFCIRKSGLCDEFEIKVTRSDFLADKRKFVQYREPGPGEWKGFKWENRQNAPYYKSKYQALVDGDMCINYFWYAVAEGVADIDDMPPSVGLIIINKKGRLQIKRSPKKLHKNKMSIEDRYKIAKKSTSRFWKLKNQGY